MAPWNPIRTQSTHDNCPVLVHSHMHACMHACTHKHTCADGSMQSHLGTSIQRHACMHTHARAHTFIHSHTHIQIQSQIKTGRSHLGRAVVKDFYREGKWNIIGLSRLWWSLHSQMAFLQPLSLTLSFLSLIVSFFFLLPAHNYSFWNLLPYSCLPTGTLPRSPQSLSQPQFPVPYPCYYTVKPKSQYVCCWACMEWWDRSCDSLRWRPAEMKLQVPLFHIDSQAYTHYD